MEKRKYRKIHVLEAEIVSIHEGGKTHREIAKHLGLERIQLKTRVVPLDLHYSA